MLIGDSLRANPGNMFYDPRQVVNKLMTGKFALAQVYICLRHFNTFITPIHL